MPSKDPDVRRAVNRAYALRHPERVKTQNKAYYDKNIEEKRAYARAYRAAHLQERHAYEKAYRDKHKDKALAYAAAYRPLHRAERRQFEKAYKLSHPDKILTIRRRRRARKAGAPRNDLTHAQWLEIQEAQDHRCYYCDKRGKGKLTQDHILPLSQGGSHTLHNVIGACRSCNSKKHVGLPPVPVQPLLLTIAPPKSKKKQTG